MKWVKFGVGVGMIFLVGVLVGFILGRQAGQKKVARFVMSGPPAAAVFERLVIKTNPTEEQREELCPIIDKVTGRLMSYYDRMLPEAHGIVMDGYKEVIPVLNEEQAELLVKKTRSLTGRVLKRKNWRFPWDGRQADEVTLEIAERLDLTAEQRRSMGLYIKKQFVTHGLVNRIAEGDDFLKLKEFAIPAPVEILPESILTLDQLETYWIYRSTVAKKPRKAKVDWCAP